VIDDVIKVDASILELELPPSSEILTAGCFKRKRNDTRTAGIASRILNEMRWDHQYNSPGIFPEFASTSAGKDGGLSLRS
jgi:hypothetical protein